LADDSFAKRHRPVEGLEDVLRALYDDPAQQSTFVGHADAGAGGNLVFEAEAENHLVESRLAVLFKQFDGRDKGRSGERS
jgi:hypothetical protein